MNSWHCEKMLLISSEGQSGVNLLFPAILKWRSGEIILVDWRKYELRLHFLLPINVVLTIFALLMCVPSLRTETSVVAVNAAVLCFVSVKGLLTPTTSLRRSKDFSISVAPALFWLDYYCTIFLCMTVLIFGFLDGSDSLYGLLAGLLLLLFGFLSIMPALNVLTLRGWMRASG